MKSNLMYVLLIFSFLAVSCQKDNQTVGFTTKAGTLLDANGNEFVMRGLNVPHAWFRDKAFDALGEVAKNKTNCVRIVWESNLPAEKLEPIVQKCIDLKMIPMVELHNATGDSTASKLYELAEYFVSDTMKALTKKFEKYLLINIANEWGNHEVNGPKWRDAYANCVDMLRTEGITSTIVIDAPGWGQNSEPVLSHALDLIEQDPKHNLLFSVHMYGSWNDKDKIKDDLQMARKLQIPIIVGEFGYNYNNGNNNLGCKVDHKQLLQTCEDLRIGYLAWSWTGNNAENAWLDIVEFSDWKTLTDWGKEVFDSPNGIKNTARKASVFITK